MNAVRCSYAGCSYLGIHFEPDGRWWFCARHFTEHLALRRQERRDTSLTHSRREAAS